MDTLRRLFAAIYGPIDRFFARRIAEHIGGDEAEAKSWQSIK